MISTMYSLDMLDTSAAFALAGIIGLLFGMFLEQAGFGSSRKLTAVFYFKDMSVVKVMFTAVVTALVGYQYLASFGLIQPGQVYVLDTYWGAQALGGLIFGVGFVMGGWCPGTALVGLASMKWDALVFIAGAIIGTIGFNSLYSVIEPIYNGLHAGPISLDNSLGISTPVLVTGFAAAAVIAFAVCTKLEQRFGNVPANTAGRGSNRLAGVLLMVLAAGTFLLPASPTATASAPATAPQQPPSAPQLMAIMEMVDGAQDHIEPAELADAILAGDTNLVVIDIRPAVDFAGFNIRGAISLPLNELAKGLAPEMRGKRIVLYSNGTTHAAQAWIALRQAGFANVYVLTDGIAGFWRECLTPPSLTGLLDQQAAAHALTAYRIRKAYFVDRVQPPKPEAPPVPPMSEPGLAAHLVSTAWLAENLANPALKIIDTRAKSTDYTKQHITGAVYLNYENIRATVDGVPNTLVPAAEIARTLGRLGISPADTVVVYSDELRDSTLVAVALERVGHKSFAVLHGGWKKWLSEKRPTSTDIPAVTAVPYEAVANADQFTISTDSVAKATGSGALVIDVRPPEFFSGKKSDEPRAGHIPGARNREFKLDLTGDTALYQDKAVLEKKYWEMGVTSDRPVVVHCRTGHQASQTYFLLKHILGHKNIRWYDGSWLGWSIRKDLPAEKTE